jgi:hypothetical protein
MFIELPYGVVRLDGNGKRQYGNAILCDLWAPKTDLDVRHAASPSSRSLRG